VNRRRRIDALAVVVLVMARPLCAQLPRVGEPLQKAVSDLAGQHARWHVEKISPGVVPGMTEYEFVSANDSFVLWKTTLSVVADTVCSSLASYAVFPTHKSMAEDAQAAFARIVGWAIPAHGAPASVTDSTWHADSLGELRATFRDGFYVTGGGGFPFVFEGFGDINTCIRAGRRHPAPKTPRR